MKVDVRTPDGNPMTADAATLPVGSALRIAPQFTATVHDEDAGLERRIEAAYDEHEGRYVLTAAGNRTTRTGVAEDTVRKIATQAIMQAAVPHCIALQLFDAEPGSPWTTVADLTANEGRIIPEWLATQVTKHGAKQGRMEVIEILYGVAALAGSPPVAAIKTELAVPHRTASVWISQARTAGYLTGMNYHVGRQADA